MEKLDELIAQKREALLQGRDWWQPRIEDNQIEGVAQVLVYRDQEQPIPKELESYEQLRQKLRRRSFC